MKLPNKIQLIFKLSHYTLLYIGTSNLVINIFYFVYPNIIRIFVLPNKHRQSVCHIPSMGIAADKMADDNLSGIFFVYKRN
jgi:hypothetical protein